MGHVNGVHEAPQQVHFSKEHPGTAVREDPTREIHRRDRRPFVIGTLDKYAIRGTRPLDSFSRWNRRFRMKYADRKEERNV